MAITRILPSASATGVPIKIAATATAGTLFHATGGTDEIWMWVSNTDTADREVTIEFGGVTAPDNHIKATVPQKETIQVVAGATLTTGLNVRAFASAANVLTMHGHINRIS